MKSHLKIILLSLLLLSGLSYAEVPPDIEGIYNKCRDKADNTVEINECSSKRLEAYDAQLNIAYKKSLAKCSESENPKLCREELKEAERNFVKYKESMLKHMEKYSMYRDGTIFSMDYLNFAADLTKLQYETLQDNYVGEEAP